MVINPRISHGVNSILDAEALRVISSMPSWNPGTVDGKPSKMARYIPISFFID